MWSSADVIVWQLICRHIRFYQNTVTVYSCYCGEDCRDIMYVVFYYFTLRYKQFKNAGGSKTSTVHVSGIFSCDWWKLEHEAWWTVGPLPSGAHAFIWMVNGPYLYLYRAFLVAMLDLRSLWSNCRCSDSRTSYNHSHVKRLLSINS